MKLSKKQKSLLENKIYKLVKESFFENNFPENAFYEKKDSEEDSNETTQSKESAKNKLALISKWLDSEQELHSVLAYKLWPDKDRDQARSDFSKKWRGKDADDKPYSFSDEEINTLYNLRNDYIKDAGFKKIK